MKPSKQLNENAPICILIQLNALVALMQLSAVYTTPVSLFLSKRGSQRTLNDHDRKTVIITNQDLFEQTSPIHETAGMEDPLSTSRDPKWWDSCNAKRNETIISISSSRYRPKRMMQEEDQYQGQDRFLRALLLLNSSLSADFKSVDHELSRRKRSIITFNENLVKTGGGGHKDRNLLASRSLSASNLIDFDQSAFNLKRPNKINSYGLKKTSFSMNSNAKLMEQAKRSKKRYYQVEQGYGDVPMITTRFHSTTRSPLTMPTTETTVARKENATLADGSPKGSMIEKELRLTADGLISRAFLYDLRTVWFINAGLNAVRNLQHLTNAINQTLSTELIREKASRELIKANLENQRTWLPGLDEIRRKAGTPKPLMATGVLTNVSHYAQLFGVAIEQMIYDQVTLDKKYVREYREVERSILKIICDIEAIVMYLERLRESRQGLYNFLVAANMSIHDPTIATLHLPELAHSAAYRDKYKLDTLDSPLLQSPRPGEANPPDSNGQVTLFASRSRMALSQRHLGSRTERLIRDQAIVNDLANMVLYYESTLLQIYVNKDR